jgi:2,3-bisphosphoglycerate-dependent phosphoglycerate mutase
MAKLVMVRHGQSLWNKLNIFTGWVDIPLSPEGIKEALEAGKKIAHIPFDVIFVSSLSRAQMTAFLAMSVRTDNKVPCVHHPREGKLEKWAHVYGEEAKNSCIPVVTAWQLNERMYGKLQGMNKDETRKKYGEEQVKIWRRSYDVAPPDGESLEMTAQRVLPYFKEKIIPYLEEGKNVFVSAHGNSLRAIVMFLDKLSKEEVVKLEIATGVPFTYEFEAGKWKKQL